MQFVGSADIYITPYLHEAQAVSGTLAYAVGAGKAIISTPYWHATELLAEGRGALVPFGDSAAIANKVGELLDDEAARHAMRKRAYLYGRDMVWKKVAQSYMRSFVRARTDRRQSPRAVYSGRVMRKNAGHSACHQPGSSGADDRSHGFIAARRVLSSELSRRVCDGR